MQDEVFAKAVLRNPACRSSPQGCAADVGMCAGRCREKSAKSCGFSGEFKYLNVPIPELAMVELQQIIKASNAELRQRSKTGYSKFDMQVRRQSFIGLRIVQFARPIAIYGHDFAVVALSILIVATTNVKERSIANDGMSLILHPRCSKEVIAPTLCLPLTIGKQVTGQFYVGRHDRNFLAKCFCE